MAEEQGVDQLLDQLVSYADRGLGALEQARSEIQQLQAKNAELEARATQLEGRIDALRNRLTAALKQPSEAALLSRPDALMRLIRETLGLDATVAEHSAQVVVDPAIDDLSPQQRLERWIKTYPKAFMPGQPQPLKIGIHEDLLAADGGDMKKVRRALAGYVKVPRYLRCLKAGAVRLDLQGRNAGFVNAEEAEYARRQLDELETGKQQREDQAKYQQTLQQQREEESRMQDKLSELMQLHARR
ncbi:ProQ/FINO family protein [Marinospirillum alkaliphilum]|uniref:ProQ/FINO family protein n=1 Tax=Marinospirillum alkaliphilum DSM 21637 TaxID=1122209 RepID=A0A1K1W0W6_9GAMM|nr:ProQ/FINO family protein [Marinospirillum alkaliphilum]SFX31002.1 ProQ/FINO family protein [Marinospirillum alkaliphilum DSM 21637]